MLAEEGLIQHVVLPAWLPKLSARHARAHQRWNGFLTGTACPSAEMLGTASVEMRSYDTANGQIASYLKRSC